MSSENLQLLNSQSHSQHHQQLLNSQNDCVRFLDRLFFGNEPSEWIEAAFKQIESNFKSQPNLINSIVDYYFEHHGKGQPSENVHVSNQAGLSQSSRTIVDLICVVPDDLANKLFDKIAEKVSNTSSTSSLSSLTAASVSTNNWIRSMEKMLNLLVLVLYKKKNWISKFISHNLFNFIVKMLKINTNLNEFILVETCILFVHLMNTSPVQILNQHLDNIFQIFISLFKHLTYLEQNKLFTDDITWQSVKFSVRLLFYVCYGLYSNQFLLFLRKKDNYAINKEFLTSILFYLRVHPSLTREKVDMEKHFKQTSNCDDFSLEWRQYCLDPLCTNYNQTLQEMHKLSNTSMLSLSLFNSIRQLKQQQQQMSSKMSANQLTPLTLNNQNVNEQSFHHQLPLSPSYLFSMNNRALIQDLENSTKKNPNASMNGQIGSTPTTPNLFSSQQQQQQSNVFQYPPLSGKDNQSMMAKLNKASIKNLTTQFMATETDSLADANDSTIGNTNFYGKDFSQLNLDRQFSSTWTSSCMKQKSLSDSNLFVDGQNFAYVKRTFPNYQSRRKFFNRNLEDDCDVPSSSNARLKLTKSEMRDTNIIREPNEIVTEHHATFKSSSQNPVLTIDSSTNTNDGDSFFSNQPETNLSRLNSIESNDILSSYFTGLNPEHSSNVQQNQNPALVIGKLKQDVNHLAMQLVYERHLRNKYEEDSNRMYFVRIECEQLKVEKLYLEKNLKDLIERYKNEIEKSLNIEKKTELDAFKLELDEKNLLIENLQKSLDETNLSLQQYIEENKALTLENVKLGNENGILMQKLEKELNLKIKNEIDQGYVKSLRQTTDLLRKKLLIMTKSQQSLMNAYNNEIADLSQIYNNPLLTGLQNGTTQSGMLENALRKMEKSGDQSSNQSLSSVLLSPLYQFQQKTIDMLHDELEGKSQAYNELLLRLNQHTLELEECKKMLGQKDLQIDELKQTLDMEVFNMNLESMRNDRRVNSSLMNVNKRLEEEILKLKARLTEQTVKNVLLEEKLKRNSSLFDDGVSKSLEPDSTTNTCDL